MERKKKDNKSVDYTKKAYLSPEEQAQLQIEINRLKNRIEVNKKKGDTYKRALAKSLRIYMVFSLIIFAGLYFYLSQGSHFPSPLLP